MSSVYHSARTPELLGLAPAPADVIHRFGPSAAFVHDLTRDGLPSAFNDCDVIYTEMAWRAGYDTFMKRAGRAPGGFRCYVEELAWMAEDTRVPFYLVTGKDILRRLPKPAIAAEGQLRKGGCMIAVYGTDLPLPAPDTLELLAALAARHQRVGDPCCGYGTAGRIFAERGKTFVLSDVNAKCIGYVARHAPSWAAR
jgi:hypothetical protein